LGLFCHLSAGQTLLASKEDQPAFSRQQGARAGGWQFSVCSSKETEDIVRIGVIGVAEAA
jgi:hypothetical protein